MLWRGTNCHAVIDWLRLVSLCLCIFVCVLVLVSTGEVLLVVVDDLYCGRADCFIGFKLSL